jgi:MFS family permease
VATALVFLPPAAVFFVMGGWGFARLMRRFPLRAVLLASMLFVTVGCAMLTQISATGTYLDVLPGMLIWSIGASIGFPALSIAAVAGAKPGEEGLASGLIGTSSRVGFPLGLSVLLTIAAATDPQPLGGASALASTVAVVGGFHYAFLASALMGVAGVMIALRIKSGMPPSMPQSQNVEDSQQSPQARPPVPTQ